MLQRLVESGETVLVIEHNLDVIKTADYIVDLGPEGGDKGGQIVASGTPEQVVKEERSYTGKYLKEILNRDKARMKERIKSRVITISLVIKNRVEMTLSFYCIEKMGF